MSANNARHGTNPSELERGHPQSQRANGGQAAFLKEGGITLFDEELELGDLSGRTLVHLQCNAGPDSLCLARAGAHVMGVDSSDEAVAFAQQLRCGGVVAGPGRVAPDFAVSGEDNLASEPFHKPVGDYVAMSGTALAASEGATAGQNKVAATSWQYGWGQVVDVLAQHGFIIERLREDPYANGCRTHAGLVSAPGRRWVWPQGVARSPDAWSVCAAGALKARARCQPP